MIRIRPMTAFDISRGMELKDQAGWNQTEADWRRFLQLQPDGAFVAEFEGRPVGTAVVCVFGPVGWVAMVLVDRAARGRGIGTRLVEHCLQWLDARGASSARLDATPRGRPIYERLGFSAEYDLARWEGAAPPGKQHPAIRPMEEAQLEVVAALDREATGTDRLRLLRLLDQQQPGALRVFSEQDRLCGYLALRPGTRATFIGPAIAADEEAGLALLESASADCAGQPIYIDIPVENRPATDWARSRGLTIQRPFTRMCRGEPVHDRPEAIWASSGPENG